MAMTKCKECKNMVSVDVNKCPHCGTILKKSTGQKLWGIISMMLIVVFLVIFYSTPRYPRHLKPSWEEWIRSEAESYAKETLKDTPVTYKSIAGIKRNSKDNYAIAVVVDMPDYNDMMLVLEAQKFGETTAIRWDTRSATAIILLKTGQELEQISW
ncbi:MAG: hypothetical protein WC374_05465 [Phycisphaerae bacterium]|jgi:hypothetical protein